MIKRNRIVAVVILIVLLTGVGCNIFAHSTSQSGILTGSGGNIGGESVGWSADEKYHTNGTTLTYSFSTTDTYLTDAYKSYVTNGASRWIGTASIINKTDGTGTGKISTYYDVTTTAVAKFCNYSANGSGHLTYWEIQMNRAKSVNATTLAHEFGHAIGLNDLYYSYNINKLMYGYENRTVTMPSSGDIWGARVITGVHSVHTWGYKFNGTNTLGNTHVKYCVSCGGLTSNVEQCTYNSNNICTKCGIAYGVQPW